MIAIVPASPTNVRLVNDGATSVTASVSGASVGISSAIDLKNATPFPVTDQLYAFVSVNDTATAGTLSASLQHSSDNSAFVLIPQTAASMVSTAGTGLTSSLCALPPDVKRYVRVIAGGAAGATGSIALTLNY